MKLSALFGFPKPEDTDPPDGATQISDLSDLAEETLRRAGGQALSCQVSKAESRSNAAYGTLTTPDVVKGLFLPEDDYTTLVFVLAEAYVYCDAKDGRAAIFMAPTGEGAMQARIPDGAFGPGVMEVPIDFSGPNSGWITTHAGGLCQGIRGAGGTGEDLTSFGPKIIGAAPGSELGAGGPCALWRNAPPGWAGDESFEVSIQYKSLSGAKVTAENRKLWVWTKEFPASA
jgi:hypothetical protein